MILFSLDEPSTTLWVSVYIGITALYFGKRVAQDAKSPLKPLKLPRYIIRLILLIIALILYIISLIMTLPSRDSLLGVVITILVFFGLGFRFTPPTSINIIELGKNQIVNNIIYLDVAF